MFSGCLLAFRRRFHTASQSEKSVKSRRLVARTKKKKTSERKSQRRKKALACHVDGGGWTRSRASDRGRSGNVFCDINYKASVAGGALCAASARRRPCALAAVFPSAPADWRRFVHPSERNVFPFPLFFSQNPVHHPCSPLIRGGRRRARESSRRRIFARPAASASPPSNRFPPPR